MDNLWIIYGYDYTIMTYLIMGIQLYYLWIFGWLPSGYD